MAENTKIGWTNITWNISTGCDKFSEGCQNCYAEIMSHRLKAMGLEKYRNDFKFTLHQKELFVPYSWKKPKMVFVNSMSDIFHEKMPLNYLKDAFRVMNECRQHTFQILTKRVDNLVKFAPYLTFTPNIWIGVTVESQNQIHRIDKLRNISASVRFLSIEPMLTSLSNLDLTDIHWVIVGGESGHKARPIVEGWVTDVKTQCEKNDIPFFFKQWGGRNKKKAGRLLHGKIYNEFPNLHVSVNSLNLN